MQEIDCAKFVELNARADLMRRSMERLGNVNATIAKECATKLIGTTAGVPLLGDLRPIIELVKLIAIGTELSEKQQKDLADVTNRLLTNTAERRKFRRISDVKMQAEDWVMKYNDFDAKRGQLPQAFQALAESTSVDLSQATKGMNILRHHMGEKEPRVISLRPRDLLCVETKPGAKMQICCFPGGCDKKCGESRHRMLCDTHAQRVRAIVADSLGEFSSDGPGIFSNPNVDLETVHGDLYGPILYKINQIMMLLENQAHPAPQQLHDSFKTLKACIVVYRQYLNPWPEIAIALITAANFLINHSALIIQAITHAGGIVFALWGAVQPVISLITPWLQTVMATIYSCFSVSIFGVPLSTAAAVVGVVGMLSTLILLLVKFVKWLWGSGTPPPAQVVEVDGDDVLFFTPDDVA